MNAATITGEAARAALIRTERARHELGRANRSGSLSQIHAAQDELMGAWAAYYSLFGRITVESAYALLRTDPTVIRDSIRQPFLGTDGYVVTADRLDGSVASVRVGL